jgi:hypothetical protein
MFGWFGKSKREEEWMKKPRRLPDGTEQKAGEEPAWILSREFANGEKKNERMYLAAETRHHDNGDAYWALSVYSYDVTHDMRYGVSSWPMGHTDDPIEVVRDMRNFEKERREAGFVQISQAPPTYRSFANRFGVHFDDDGRVFSVTAEQPLDKATYLSRKSLDALFHQKQKPIESWEDLYAQLVDSWPADWTEDLPVEPEAEKGQDAPQAVPASPESGLAEKFNQAAEAEEAGTPGPETPEAAEEPAAEESGTEAPAEEKPSARPVTLEDLAQDPSYPEFAHYSRLMIQDVKKISNLFSDNAPARNPTRNLQAMDERHTVRFNSASKAKLAQRLADATLLVGLMRAGAQAYADLFSGKKPMTPEGMQLVSDVGEACAVLAEKRLGLTPEQSKKVADLLSHGEDPFGPALPLEKLFEKFPPAAFQPESKKAEAAAKTAKANKSKYQGGRHTPF